MRLSAPISLAASTLALLAPADSAATMLRTGTLDSQPATPEWGSSTKLLREPLNQW
jgi:hypothetical protein